jgi:hypothetical protein
MYYIRIYHNIAKTKDYNETIDSPSMALSPPQCTRPSGQILALSNRPPLHGVSPFLWHIYSGKNNRNAG